MSAVMEEVSVMEVAMCVMEEVSVMEGVSEYEPFIVILKLL